jgi:uncharacterized protein
LGRAALDLAAQLIVVNLRKFCNRELKDRTPYSALGSPLPAYMAFLLGIALVCLCFLFSAVLSNLILGLLGYDKIDALMGSQGGRYTYRLVQGLSNLLSWGLPAALWAVYVGGFRRHMGLAEPVRWRLVLLAVAAVLAALPLVEGLIIPHGASYLPDSMRPMEQWAQDQEKAINGTLIKLLGDGTAWGFLTNVVVVALIPAIAEELLFRGFLVGSLQRMLGLHAAVWIGALIFSFVHFQFYGFFARVVLGALLGYLYAWSGDLRPSMFAHFAHNFVNLLLAMLAIRGWIDPAYLDSDVSFGLPLVLLSAALASTLLYLYLRRVRYTEKQHT